ncbi:hypothetical protein ASG54_08505 [Aureimonas sp. Leaf460]|nr:hypothetical protein ASG62_24200 [Aureimonas sp. Leaf427]KQT79595.1 hypothetical protein ASG54_08505 [Aureimonas sp. Leaf460]
MIVGCAFDVLCVVSHSEDGGQLSLTSGVLGATCDDEPAPLGESLALRAGSLFRADPFLVSVRSVEPEPLNDASPFAGPGAFATLGVKGIPSRRHAIVGLGTMGFASLLLAGFYPSAPASVARRPASAFPATADLSTSEAVVAQMRRRLLELGAPVEANVTAKDGRVELELPGPVSERNILLAVADEIRLRTRVPIVTKTAVDDRVLSLVSGVSLSPARLVVGRDGKTYAEGDKIADDWQVAQIDENGVIFSRRGEQVVLSLEDAP